MNSFQIECFKSVLKSSSKGENLMISPLSIYHILSLIANGSLGDTKKEMLSTLGDKNQEEMNKINKLISSIINNFKTVEFANSIFSKEKPLSTFIENTKENYKAHIDELKDANQINKWCDYATHGLIPKIIEVIPPDYLMVLINAIYFKGIWKIQFNQRFTEKREFFNFQNEKILTDFMYSEEKYNYFENDLIQAISLDYQKDNMEALIILPKDNDINQYINKFNQDEYNNIINKLNNQKVKLYLPKFKMKYQTYLEETLKELGIKLAFNPDKADFSSMIKTDKNKFYINRIVHSTFIRVDEKGTEAAAVTVVKFRGRESRPGRNIIMDINHPFLFIIRSKDLPSGHDILFISKVENLNEENEIKESKEATDLNTLECINISFNRPVKWYMYFIKLILKTRDNIDVRARPMGAGKAISVVEALKKLGYITYGKYYTTTQVIEGKIKRFIFINIKKTKDFQKLFDEREAERKKILNK